MTRTSKERGGSFRELKSHLPLFDNSLHRHDRGWPHPPPQSGAQNAIRAENLIGKELVGEQGEEFGEIEDVLIDPKSGQAQRVIVSVGGFLGIGEKQVAIDTKRLQMTPGQENVRISGLTKDQVEQMPTFEMDENMTSFNQTPGNTLPGAR